LTTVLVVGATGELGRRVCRLLRGLGPGLHVVGASRSGRTVEGAPTRRVDVRDERSLAPALEGVALVVNAVGPYRYDPGPLLRACVAARAHYVDLAEDLVWLAAVAEEASRSGAAAAGLAVIPGCSTVPGLVALLASRWAERADVASVSAFLSMGSANPPSRGLLAGLLTPLGRAAPGGARWFTKLVRAGISDGRQLCFGAWPAPFPPDGMRLGARRVPVRFHAGFDRRWLTAALRLAAPLVGRLPARWIPTLSGLALPFARAATRAGTPHGVLLVRGEDAAGAELDRVEVHARSNGLDVPAAPAVWVAQRLLAGGLGSGGLRGLEQVVAPADAFSWLRGAGYEVREGGGPGRS
jgi:NAD(P)-dependent dehydrogenase (short-subunit alcohol dehydrogenase family)